MLLRFCIKVHFCPGNPGLSMPKRLAFQSFGPAPETDSPTKGQICDTEAPLNIGLSRDEQGFSKFWAFGDACDGP